MKAFIAGSVLGLCAGIGIAAWVGLPSQEAIGQEALPEPPREPPAYMIVLGEVFDRPAFMEGYAAKLAPLYAEHGGAYLAIGGGPAIEVLEGDYAPPSYVLSKWPNADAARSFWNSEAYDVLRRARIDNAWGEFDVLLVQGVPDSRSGSDE